MPKQNTYIYKVTFYGDMDDLVDHQACTIHQNVLDTPERTEEEARDQCGEWADDQLENLAADWFEITLLDAC